MLGRGGCGFRICEGCELYVVREVCSGSEVCEVCDVADP